MLSRRRFIGSLAAVAAAAGAPARAWAAMLQGATDYPVQEVPGNGVVFLGEGGAVLALPTKEAPLIVDAKFTATADDLARQIARHVRTLPTMLINTHHHADHTGGNWTFSPTAKIVAHRNLKPRLEGNLPMYRSNMQAAVDQARRAGAEENQLSHLNTLNDRVQKLTAANFAASQEFEKDLTITHGGLEIQLHHFGPGHTDNDLVVHIPSLNILHMGDLVFNNCHPFIDRPAGATTTGWQESARQAIRLCDEKTIVIAGHGPVGTREAITQQIDYFEYMRVQVTKAIKTGRSRDEVGDLELKPYKDYQLAQLRQRALQAMYDELIAGGMTKPLQSP